MPEPACGPGCALRAYPGYELLVRVMPGYRRVAWVSGLEVLRVLRALRAYLLLTCLCFGVLPAASRIRFTSA